LAYDFSDLRRLVDIGGGYGQLLAAVLQATPDLCGILFDLPSAAAQARTTLESAGVAERCELVGGDMFTSELPRGDAYVLSNVLHDWGDDGSEPFCGTVGERYPAISGCSWSNNWLHPGPPPSRHS
jgi:O-methyltransferase domain